MPPERRFLDYREMVRSDIDGVIVCPSGSHAAPSIAAAEAGKHVLVEKPMCTTVAEARGDGRGGGEGGHDPDGGVHEAARARVPVRAGDACARCPMCGSSRSTTCTRTTTCTRRSSRSTASTTSRHGVREATTAEHRAPGRGGARLPRRRRPPARDRPRLQPDPRQHDPRHRQPARLVRAARSVSQRGNLAGWPRGQHRLRVRRTASAPSARGWICRSCGISRRRSKCTARASGCSSPSRPASRAASRPTSHCTAWTRTERHGGRSTSWHDNPFKTRTDALRRLHPRGHTADHDGPRRRGRHPARRGHRQDVSGDHLTPEPLPRGKERRQALRAVIFGPLPVGHGTMGPTTDLSMSSLPGREGGQGVRCSQWRSSITAPMSATSSSRRRCAPGSCGWSRATISTGHTHDLGHEVFLVLDGYAEFTIDGEIGDPRARPGVLRPRRRVARGSLCRRQADDDVPLGHAASGADAHAVGSRGRQQTAVPLRRLHPLRAPGAHRTAGADRDTARPPSRRLARPRGCRHRQRRRARIRRDRISARASDQGDKAAAKAAIDAMWASIYTTYKQLQEMELGLERTLPGGSGGVGNARRIRARAIQRTPGPLCRRAMPAASGVRTRTPRMPRRSSLHRQAGQ